MRIRVLLLAAGLLVGASSGCKGEVGPIGEGNLCGLASPPVVQVATQRVQSGTAVDVAASGGSGQFRFELATNASGGELRGARFIAGPTPGTDEIRVTDLECGGEQSVRIEVVGAFEVRPLRAALKPGTVLQLQTSGLLGQPLFRLVAAPSGGTVDGTGRYVAGPAEGLDLLEVRDDRTGDMVLLRMEVRANARFRASPPHLALPPGGRIPLVTADGTDAAEWSLLSGPGRLEAGALVVDEGARGMIELQAFDPFLNETVTARATLLAELTRPSQAHGLLSDVASLATGDLDLDGIADVAVGVPDSEVGRVRGGAVFVYRGGTDSLEATPRWALPARIDGSLFGTQVAIGDLDGDARPELVVGSPRDDVTVNESGAVHLYRFGPDGPVPLRAPLSRVGSGRFGSALALADVDGDGDLDLAAGAPESDPRLGGGHRGTVDLFLMQAGREIPEISDLTLGGGDLDPAGVYTTVTSSALQFGSAIATADFNRDGKADLAVGSAVNNTKLRAGRRQWVVWIYFSRGGARPFHAVPDAVVVPTNPDDVVEGRLQVGSVIGPGGTPLLLAGLDQADTPDLSASGGNPARQDGGAVFLFDLSGISVLAEPAASPPQILRADAFAQLYSARSFDRLGRSFATIDVDGQPGEELVLGAINAAGEAQKVYPLAGRLAVYPLSTLTRGTVTNSPLSWRQGQVAEVLGTGLVTWLSPVGERLVAVLGRADTSQGVATGRVDVLARAGSGLSEWTATSHEIPAEPANEKFGSVLAAGRSVNGAPLAVIGSPNSFGPAENKDNPGAGKVFLFDGMPTSAAREVLPSPLSGNSRPVGSDLGFTDFDGDGRQDLLIGLPGYVVPGKHREAQNSATFEVVRSECLGDADEVVGAVEVQLGQPDGSFVPAHRIWAPRKISGCSSTDPEVCVRTKIGSHLVGGFDFNGDGKQDLATTRNRGLEIIAGRPVDSPQLAKLTMGCDPLFSAPATRVTSAPASVGDLDGDGCDDVGYRFQDSGFAIVFGFDPSGTRCGGRTSASVLQIGGFDRLAGGDLKLGGAAARVRNFFGDGRDILAVSAASMSFEGVRQSGVLLFDVAVLLQRRVVGGTVQVEAFAEGINPLPLLYRELATGFGTSLASGIDLTGDGISELVVGATEANVGKPSSGGVFVFSGVGQSPGRMEPFLSASGELLEKSLFGARVSCAPAKGDAPPFLLIGAPNSFRTGTQNGTAWYLRLPVHDSAGGTGR